MGGKRQLGDRESARAGEASNSGQPIDSVIIINGAINSIDSFITINGAIS